MGDQEPTGRGELLSTGDMARLSDNTLRTVRFYEEAGILRPVRRSSGGHRMFTRHELERLRLVTDMRAAGLSLNRIREILSTKDDAESGGVAAHLTRESLAVEVEALDRRIEVLTRLRDELASSREILENCEVCREPERFPKDCGTCSVMLDSGELPRSLKVLWSIDTPSKNS